MLKLNFETYFFAKGHKPAFILLVLFLIILFIFSRYRKKNWINIIIPSLFIGFYPYFWYLLFANHSQIHYFYTYRIQAITVFVIFTAMSCAIDWKIFFSKSININIKGITLYIFNNITKYWKLLYISFFMKYFIQEAHIFHILFY